MNSELKYYFAKSIPISFFIIILVFRYLITPFLMVISEAYLPMLNGRVTDIHHQQVATYLMIYEMICIFIAIEICIKINKKKHIAITNIKKAYRYPNAILIISIIIGITSLLFFPNLLDNFHFFVVGEEIDIANRNTIVAICGFFSEFIQIFIFIMVVKRCVYQKDINNKYNSFILFTVAILNVIMMWSSNRMNIFLVAGTTLTIMSYYFPEKKKIFYSTLLVTSIIMVVFLSSYRLYGTVGTVTSSKFNDFFKPRELATQMQLYFAGPDTIAGSVAIKEYYGDIITPKTFLNDSFLGVKFINQLPFFFKDRLNTTQIIFNYFYSNGYNPGLIIPMIGQGYIYFGFLLAPIFSIISVFLLFKSDEKSRNDNDVASKYVLILLAFNFAIFPMYNYILMMQNLFNRIIPLYMIIWVNKHVHIKRY
ncbi:MAG: hypothetical protein RSC97_09650 [Eubacterium sp.]